MIACEISINFYLSCWHKKGESTSPNSRFWRQMLGQFKFSIISQLPRLMTPCHVILHCSLRSITRRDQKVDGFWHVLFGASTCQIGAAERIFPLLRGRSPTTKCCVEGRRKKRRRKRRKTVNENWKRQKIEKFQNFPWMTAVRSDGNFY